MGIRRLALFAAVACACGADDPPTYGHWSPMADGPVSGSLTTDAAVWDDGQLFVWQLYTSQLYIYARATDSWRAASTVEAPARRPSPAFVWADGKIYFWGRTDCSQAGCGYGFIYDPTADAWSRMSNVGAPATGQGSAEPPQVSAFWTGTEILIWDTYVGGLYNPSTDSWRPMSSAGAPTPRSLYESVWTGTELLVWGGSTPSLSNEGARYDPSSDRWTAITSTNAPRPRIWPVAAWTGAEMLIWGGVGCDGTAANCEEGAAYDPALDHWRGVPNHNGPGSALHGTAVWDGHEVLVWGGFHPEDSVANSARWDPTTNTWTRMAKSASDNHLFAFGFWTGSDAVFWGSDEPPSNAGGFYAP